MPLIPVEIQEICEAEVTPDVLYDAERKLISAKGFLSSTSSNFVFFYSLVAYMELHPSDPDQIKTLGVSPTGRLFYNPAFISGCPNVRAVAGILAHEALHVAFLHFVRRGGRDAKIWNIAADMKVNSMVLESGLTLPSFEGGLFPIESNETTYSFNEGKITIETKDMSAEQIYSLLCDHVFTKKDISHEELMRTREYGDEHNEGEENGESTISEEEAIQLGSQWRHRLAQAAETARSRGSLPRALQAEIDGIIDPKIPWNQLLWRFLSSEIISDFNWTRPSKRSAAAGVLLPGLEKENLDIIVHIDTSGSMSMQDIEDCVSELIGIKQTSPYVRVTILQGDSEIQDVIVIDSETANEIVTKMVIKGRGGTSHIPVAEWLKKNSPEADVIICMTDGMTSFPGREAANLTKWIWLITESGIQKNEHYPFGDVIFM